MIPTPLYSVEFFARLVRVDPLLSEEKRAAERAAGIARARTAIAEGPAPRKSGEKSEPQAVPAFGVSDREMRFINAKRRAVIAARRLLRV